MKKLRSAKAVALVVALGRSESPVVVHHYLLSLCDHRSPRTSPARRVAARRVHLAGHFAGATPHPRPGRTKLFHLRRTGPDCGSCERSRPVHSDGDGSRAGARAAARRGPVRLPLRPGAARSPAAGCRPGSERERSDWMLRPAAAESEVRDWERPGPLGESPSRSHGE